ncbi:MAG: hypothetical protein AAB631_02420 [Patescibacteria group bacterium]
MKTVLCFLIVLITLVPTASAQLVTDSITFSTSYGGVLYTGSYRPENGAVLNATSFRLGGKILAPAFSGFVFRGEAGMDLSPSGFVSIGKLRIERDIQGTLSKFIIGQISRPITAFLRPAPFTPGGHFEPPSLAAMPGSGTGFVLSYQNSILAFQEGIFYLPSGKTIEANAGLSYTTVWGNINVAGFGSYIRKGIAFGVEQKELTLKCFIASDSVTTGFCKYRTEWCTPYVTANYNKVDHSFDHLELGWTKTYKGPDGMGVLIGMGWQYHTKLTNVYVQIYH